MKISQRQINELHDVISVEIEKNDYQPKVEEKLRDYRKKANIPGFRPGKVPIGLIRKQYEKPLMYEEVNALLSTEVNKYIGENKINIIGYPVPVPNNDIDWEKDESMTFEFEIGIEPEINIDLSAVKGLTKAEIELDDKTLDEEVDNFARRFGSMEDIEVAEREDFLQGKYIQADSKGNPLEGEERLEKEGSLPLRALTDKAAKNWVGKKTGDNGVLNLDKDIKEGFNEASVTGFDQGDLDNARLFTFEIDKVSRLKSAELNQELFDKAFGEGVVSSEEELRNRLGEQLKAEFSKQSSQYLFNQVYEKLMEMDVTMPEKFLQRWLSTSGEEPMSEKEAEEQMPSVLPAIKWQFIRDSILRDHEVVIDEASIMAAMKERLRNQFQLPGGADDMDEILNGIAKQALDNEEQRQRIVDELMIGHLTSIFDEKVNAKSKKMSWDKFIKEASK
ncbi:MAG: trigger factor [Cryomorphaceae bacterium]|nr:trigger factor [Cryomorphaceae bacterium]